MIHETKRYNSETIVMWSNPNVKGDQEFKVNTKETIKIGDYVSVGSNEDPAFYLVKEVLEVRPSTVNPYKYVSMIAERVTKIKQEV